MDFVKNRCKFVATIFVTFLLFGYSNPNYSYLYSPVIRCCTICFLLFLIMTVIHWFYTLSTRQLYPSGPCPLPWLGNLLSMNQEDPRRSFMSWSRQYGPVYTLYLPKPTVIFTDYESIEFAFGNKGPVPKLTAGRPHGFLWEIFMGSCMDGSGIILSEHGTWNDNRTTALSLLRDSGVGNQSLETKILDEVEKLKKHWNQKIDDSIQPKALQLNPENDLSFCVGNIIERILFSKSFDFGDPQFLKFKKCIDTILEINQTFEFLLANNYRVFKYCLQVTNIYMGAGFALTDRFESLIDEHEVSFEADEDDRDILHGFIARTKYNESEASRLSLCISVGDLWTGGMETTFTTIRWALIYLLHHPGVMRRCQQEIDSVYGDLAPAYTRRAETPFLQATIAEIQRIVNVLPWSIPHRSTGSFCYRDYVIPENTDLIPVFGSVLFDEHIFRSPENFRPERFLNNDGSFNSVKELIPFGIGPRKCPGETMARTELYLVLASLLKHYDFNPVPKTIIIVCFTNWDSSNKNTANQPLPSLRRNRGITTKPCDYQLIISRRTSLP